MTDDIFFDTDCISAFLWTKSEHIIENMYKGRIAFPEPVYNELCNPVVPHLKQGADALIKSGIAFVKQIEIGTEEYDLFRLLTSEENDIKIIGKGEASGIALAKVYNGILASNNHRDIDVYIDKYNLKCIDTGLILKEALNKNIINENAGNIIWNKMLKKNRILPTTSFTDYINKIR